MSEETVVETQEVETEQETQEVESVSQVEAETISLTEAKKLRREHQSLRERLRQYEEAERKQKEAEMTESERLKAQLLERDAEVQRLQIESLQRKAADEAGLPIAFVDRIRGETLEDMVTDAKGLLEAMPKAGKTNISTTNPGSGKDAKESDEERLRRLGFR
jgi:hypothetical protein